MRLGGVFDHDEAVSIRDLHDRIHIRRLTIEMHREDCLGPRRDGCFDCLGIHCVRAGIDVDKYGFRTRIVDRSNACDEREGHGDHFVARADAGGEQRQVQGTRAAVHAYSMCTAAIRGKFLLKRGDFAAENELAGVQDALNGDVHLRLNTGVLRLEIEKRDQVTTSVVASERSRRGRASSS